jgi:putative endonuclease
VPADARAASGGRAETLAADFLTARGLTIIERNFRCRRGEIDIIARDGDTLVFAEVRLRTRSDYGGAAASITARKRARMTAAALYYLGRRSHAPPPCRFDALLLDRLEPGRIEWLKDVISA